MAALLLFMFMMMITVAMTALVMMQAMCTVVMVAVTMSVTVTAMPFSLSTFAATGCMRARAMLVREVDVVTASMMWMMVPLLQREVG